MATSLQGLPGNVSAELFIFDKDRNVKKGYLISLNGEKVDAAAKISAGGEGDCLDIFTAIAGG